MKKFKKVIIILIIICGVGCLGCFLFPVVSDLIIKESNEGKMEEWKEDVEVVRTEGKLGEPEVEGESIVVVDKEVEKEDIEESENLYKACLRYNKWIYSENQDMLFEERAWEGHAVNLSKYGIEGNIFGSVTVESIGITYPLYLGSSDVNLLKGLCHMYGTSLPLGGKNSHCVISGHCGMIRTEMFRHLDEVEIGDIIKITNPWGVLTYKVVSTEVSSPSDYSNILIEEGKDLVSLITCYPYPENTHRLIVTAERVD